MTPSHDQEYEYKPPWSGILFGVLVFGAFSAIGVFAARSNQGLVINGIARLSPQGAAVFWWVLTAISFGFVLVAILMACHRVIRSQRIVLTPTAIIVPKSRWSHEEIAIPYARIADIAESQAGKHRFLKILYFHGKIEIQASMLPTRMAYETIRETLKEALENPFRQRESRIRELTQSHCPKCGTPFTRSAAEAAVSESEQGVSAVKPTVAQCLEDVGLHKDTPVRVCPNYPINCETCRARWWYSPAPDSFAPRPEADSAEPSDSTAEPSLRHEAAGIDTPQHFIASYTDADEYRIAFAWNGKHSEDFQDTNYDFRKAVLEIVLEQPDTAPLTLVRDLFHAETEFSREAWCIDDRVVTLAEIMLTRGGRASLMAFLQGKSQSFDASMACGAICIDRRLAADLLDEIASRLHTCRDDRERELLELGQRTFAERASASGGD